MRVPRKTKRKPISYYDRPLKPSRPILGGQWHTYIDEFPVVAATYGIVRRDAVFDLTAIKIDQRPDRWECEYCGRVHGVKYFRCDGCGATVPAAGWV